MNHRPSVEVVDHVVARDASLAVSIENHPELRQRPSMIRQQRGMKIDARGEPKDLNTVQLGQATSIIVDGLKIPIAGKTHWKFGSFDDICILIEL